MDPAVAAKRLTRIQAKLEVMEKLLEDKSRELYIANREVEKTNDHLQNVIGSMLSSLIVTDADGTIQTANQATLDLLGYTAAELAGQPLAAIDVDRDTILTYQMWIHWSVTTPWCVRRSTTRPRMVTPFRCCSPARLCATATTN